MNGSYVCKTLLIFLATVFITNHSSAQANGYAVMERGLDYRVLQKVTVEHGTNRIHKYTELATGMNYTNANGQLVESKEAITLLSTGGAAATQGRHQVYFPANIYNGVLEVVTPDGRHLRSRPLGISYDDGSNSVFIATLKSAQGYLTSSNTVTYRDAFTGFKADLVCTYRRSGFECDLVFRQQPPTPGDYGLDQDFSTLQMVTEFFDTADPEQIPAAYDDCFGLQDATLKFGKLTMTHGKAFGFNGTNQPSPNSAATVYKTWLRTEGRSFLIESVPVIDLAEDLDALPLTASIQQPTSSIKSLASNHRTFPPTHEFITDTNQMLLATTDFRNEPGVVLDYNTIDSDQTDFTFYADNTYLVSSNAYVTLYGSITFEAGAVVKFAPTSGAFVLDAGGTITCNSTAEKPVIFTSANDNSVGEIIPGSTGSPSVFDGLSFFSIYGSSTVFSNVNFCYGNYCFYIPNGDVDFWNCRFLPVYCIGYVSGDYVNNLGGRVGLHNVLIQSVFPVNPISNSGPTFAEHVTFSVSYDVYGSYNVCEYYGFGGNAYDYESAFINCLVIVENLPGDGSDFIPAAPQYAPCNGGGAVDCSGVMQISWDTSIFNTGASAHYYLATNSAYRNTGTTDISPELLAMLRTMTTYAPQDGGMPDTNAEHVDLGYHYPVNEDSDHDGLPDAWEWKWFGSYVQSGQNHYFYDTNMEDWMPDGLGDYDGDGVSNSQEYLNGTDPNKIRFTIESPNDYVNYTNVSVQTAIVGGVPSYYAIFVNNATTTNWLPFTTTNLTVNLGSTDGVYNVVVGLKGLPVDATETWHNYGFTLDRVAPVLNVTNPILTSGAATVIKPYLQLQGFANKPLASLCYDISNAAGIFTNQDAFVNDQFYDTNKFDFTTNYFHAYDVPLGTNGNSITLHVTDRAGNTTTTNFNVVLDYTSATNPPVVKLIWPLDGMLVSGTNITMRGTMSDETGSIVAQVANGDGTTNMIEGLVERNGMFWIENVPLNGTNKISIQAVDASGKNTTSTNFIVYPGSLALTIDSTPTGDDLYKSVGNVSGTIGDPNAMVAVNGINATVDASPNADGTYNWSATGVPNSGEGTVVYQACAFAADGGSSPQANAALPVERGHYVAITTHKASQTWRITSLEGWAFYAFGKGYGASASGSGASWLLTYSGSEDDFLENGGADYSQTSDDKYNWSTSSQADETRSRRVVFDNSTPTHTDDTYPDFDDPFRIIRAVPYADVTESGWAGSYGIPNGYPPTLIHHYYADSQKTIWKQGVAPDITTTELQMKPAHTEVKLYTGGKAQAGRKSLFCLHCSAEAYGRAKDPGWMHTPQAPVDYKKLQVLGKTPGADGRLWVALDNDSEQVITVTAKGVKDYNAGPQTTDEVERFSTHITANNHNLEDEKPEFCVGQQVTFLLDGLPGDDQVVDKVGKWKLPTKYVNEKWQHQQWVTVDPVTGAGYMAGYGSENYRINTSSLENTTTTSCWFVNGQGGSVSIGLNLKFQNGQMVSIAASGDFTVYRPQITDLVVSGNPFVGFGTDGGIFIGVSESYGSTRHEMDWDLYVDVDLINYPGTLSYLQLINDNESYDYNYLPIHHSTSGEYWLDNSTAFGDSHQINDSDMMGADLTYGDAPGIQVSANSYVQKTDNFLTYVQFRPNGGILVTIGIIDWGWVGDAEKSGGVWSLVTGFVSGPHRNNDDTFPQWEKILSTGMNQ